MHQMLVKSGNRALTECGGWTSSPQQRPGLEYTLVYHCKNPALSLLFLCFCDIVIYVFQYLKRATSKRTSQSSSYGKAAY